jgi:predicted CopG family antitoxin
MSGRKTTTTSAEAHEALFTFKREGESASDLFKRAAAALEAHDPESGESPSTAEIPEDVLTEDHIPDIANTAASRTVSELEQHRPTR